jgi:trans-aconitate 2-methyltransferase
MSDSVPAIEAVAPQRAVDWDGSRYDRVSDPQVAWGRRVIARLAPRAHERILDLGCGTGRLTLELAEHVPGGLVVGLDLSDAMLRVAAQASRGRGVQLVRGDGTRLPFQAAFDAVFSTATLHWIPDHLQAFQTVFDALRPGGRFVAQAGGGRNLQRLYTRAATLARSPEFAGAFAGWRDPWNFQDADATHARLERVGFTNVNVSLEEAPVAFPSPEAYTEFVSCVCLRHHLARLPLARHEAFTSALMRLAEADDPPLTLDYWRLNIEAQRKP